jgi:bifunctional non-homologous end joining protein LigD
MSTSLVSPVEPISFVTRSAPFDSPDWLFEPLYDGHRALLHVDDSRCHIMPAGEQPIPGLAELQVRLAEVAPPAGQAMLDGLVVALDRQGAPIRGARPGEGFPAFAAFDLPWLETDLRSSPLARRRASLATLLPRDTGPLFKIFALEEHGRALFAAARRMDLDGVVARRLSDPYAPESVWYIIPNPSAGQGEAAPDPFARREPARRHRRAPAE